MTEVVVCGECRFLKRIPVHEKENGKDSRYCRNPIRVKYFLPDLMYENDPACKYGEKKEGE